MKHITFLFDDKKKYKKAQEKAQKSKYTSVLIQLYCGTTNKKILTSVVKQMKKDFPNAHIVGATTAGEICHANMHEKSIVVSLSLFKDTRVRVYHTQKLDYRAGQTAAEAVMDDDTKAMIVLSEGLKVMQYESFLQGIKEKNSEVIIAGGLAGDNFQLKQTYIFAEDQVYDEGIVLVSFSSKKLRAANRYNLNWTPIGKEFTITEVEHNIVKSIDHIPAATFYEKYLGRGVIENEQVLPNFQLLFYEGGTTVARTPMSVEGDNLVFAAEIQQGQKVQFGFSNEDSVLEESYAIRDEMGKKPAEAIYIFSCIARKTLLGNVLEKEFSSFEDIAPTAGFFTYGEFYSTQGKDVLLNCTTTLLLLSESNKVKKLTKQRVNKRTLDNITFNALVHFIEQTSAELRVNVQLMNQYKDAVDASLLVSKTDINGVITYVNDNFCKISKYSKEELLGQSHNIVRDPQVSSFVFKKMWQTILANKIYKGVFSNRAKDGSIYYVSATIMPIVDEHGEVCEFIAVRQDITKQVHAKQRMEVKEKLIRAIFDNQESIVIHASKTQGMLGVNKKLFDYFEYNSFEEFKTKNRCICDLFIQEEGYINAIDDPSWLDTIANDDMYDYKVKMRTKTGAINIFTIKVKRISDEYIINLYDITKLEEALLKAYSSERAKAAFLANMSHEIRTPLNGILGFTDILTKKDLDRDTKRYIDIIHKSGQTLLNVVNDILDFSKIENGELKLHIAPYDLFEEMEATVSTFASVSQNKHINYYAYIDTQIPAKLRCDIQRLKQVMNNLISNAIKFTPQEGEVIVKVELLDIVEKQAKLRFSVEDSGIGIHKDKLATIFQAFSQADTSISREYGGTGLGLSISNQYIKMMGSHIEVESEVGKGSKFFFTIDFEIVDDHVSVTNQLNMQDNTVAILNSYEGEVCGVNEVVASYLQGWHCPYEIMEDFSEISSDIDILIVCAKLFEGDVCKGLLEAHPQLKIVYIEGSSESFECDHDRFYNLKQPLTGSALFDALVSLIELDKDTKALASDANIQHPHYAQKVLVAEDNETNQILVSVLLDERGIVYDIANNGQEVLDKIDQGDSYGLILMDINMPVLDGLEATKRLRAQGYTKPIVSLSANVIESDTQSFRDAGVDDTLNKPIVPQELDAILERYLKDKDNEKQVDRDQSEALEDESIMKDETSENTTQEGLVISEYPLDIVDIEVLKKSLMLNEKVIKKLFASLIETFVDILEALEVGMIDKSTLHKLKGTSGNMRFTNLFEMSAFMEKNVEKMTQEEKQIARSMLQQHLQHAIQEIQKL